MVLIDTSAWIEFLRATGSQAHGEVRSLLKKERSILTTDVVVMELLAGAGDEQRAEKLRRFMLTFAHAPIRGLADFEGAAELYRACRRQGFTPRALNDCLVATVALREGSSVLHHDRDFTNIARCCGLQIHGG